MTPTAKRTIQNLPEPANFEILKFHIKKSNIVLED